MNEGVRYTLLSLLENVDIREMIGKKFLKKKKRVFNSSPFGNVIRLQLA